MIPPCTHQLITNGTSTGTPRCGAPGSPGGHSGNGRGAGGVPGSASSAGGGDGVMMGTGPIMNTNG